jgi:hypothetical protein
VGWLLAGVFSHTLTMAALHCLTFNPSQTPSLVSKVLARKKKNKPGRRTVIYYY